MALHSQYINYLTTSYHSHYKYWSPSQHNYHLSALCNRVLLGLSAPTLALTSMHWRDNSEYDCWKLCTLEICISWVYIGIIIILVLGSHGDCEKTFGLCLEALRVFPIIGRTIIKFQFIELFPSSKVLIVYRARAHGACGR